MCCANQVVKSFSRELLAAHIWPLFDLISSDQLWKTFFLCSFFNFKTKIKIDNFWLVFLI